jgi:putative sigma-54 modulation protein
MPVTIKIGVNWHDFRFEDEKLKEILDFVFRRLHHRVMKLILSTHNLTLTKAIEDHLMGRIEKLEHFDKRAIDARVTLEHDNTRVAEKQFNCSIRLGMRGTDLFAEDRQSDLYAAIDGVAKKIQQQIRTRHSKVKAHKHKTAAKIKKTKQDTSEE